MDVNEELTKEKMARKEESARETEREDVGGMEGSCSGLEAGRAPSLGYRNMGEVEARAQCKEVTRRASFPHKEIMVVINTLILGEMGVKVERGERLACG